MAIDFQHFEVQRFPHDIIKVREADHREDVSFYLALGSEITAVIDTGLGGGNLRTLIASLSPARPIVLQTHLHWDHIGASQQFEEQLAHSAEIHLERTGWPWQPPEEIAPSDGRVDFVADGGEMDMETLGDGETIYLGSRVLEVIHTPGHSPGSVSLLDRTARALFCGDLCYLGQMLLFVRNGDPGDYRDSLRRLASLSGNVDAFYPAHGTAPIMAEDVLAIHNAYEDVWQGRQPDRSGAYLGNPVAIHEFGSFSFLMPPR